MSSHRENNILKVSVQTSQWLVKYEDLILISMFEQPKTQY